MRSRPWLAYTQVAYAGLLLARDAPGDRARTRDLLAQAVAHTRELGMAALLGRALAAAGGAAAAGGGRNAVPTAGAPSDCFRQDGDYWTIAYRGVSCQMKDARGLHYVA
jgi:hypothetical protein